MKYAPSTGGFYSLDIHGDDIPSDAIDITFSQHRELLAGQAAGQRIVPGAHGAPQLVDQPPPSVEQRWAVHQFQAQAALDASDITMIRCVEHGVAVPAEWATYRGALRAIVRATSGDPTQPLPSRPAYPAGT